MQYAHTINITIYLDTGVGEHRRIVDVYAIAKSVGRGYCDALLWFYVFTGKDSTSASKDLRKLQNDPKYIKTFQKLGCEWNVKPELYQQLEAFI